MLWIALVIAAGLLVGALIITLGYRHSMMIVTLLVAAVIAVLVWYLRFGNPEGAGLVGPEELQLNNLEMSHQYRSSYRMSARLVNNSPEYTVRSVTITITASDCQNEGRDCIAVGEQRRQIPVEVPPGQARDIVEQYVFSRFVLQGELQWRTELSGIQAAR